jgi:hypothetical protein
MQTATQRKEKEDAIRQRERDFENALGRESNLKSAVARLEPYVPKYEKQLAAIAKMEEGLEDLDPSIDVGGMHGLAKVALRDLLARARNDQERRLTETSAALARTRQEWKKAVAALKEFDA